MQKKTSARLPLRQLFKKAGVPAYAKIQHFSKTLFLSKTAKNKRRTLNQLPLLPRKLHRIFK
jgi:hypothetical protein